MMNLFVDLTKWFLLFHTIFYFIGLIFKVKHITLNCGLFAFSGWDHVNDAKIKILGIYNKSRGRDSCGYYMNNRIVKSAGKLKEFSDYIEDTVMDFTGKSQLFIGHTRQGTFGAKTEENAHPFNIADKLVIAHNGTLDNVWELCDKYKIDYDKVDVDSEALGLLIQQEGFSILSEYRGYAALLFSFYNQPDTLYVYHGSSKLYKHALEATEERPMFYMKTAEGMYFSSMENSLKAIRNSPKEVPQVLPTNKVFKFTNGRVGAKPYEVYREWNNIDLEKKTYYHAPTTYNTAPTRQIAATVNTTHTKETLFPAFTKPADNNGYGTAIFDKDTKNINIELETYPMRNFNPDFMHCDRDYVFYHMGRYYHIDSYHSVEGIQYLDRDGFVYETSMDNIDTHYFYEGIMLKNKNSWLVLNQHIEAKDQEGLMLSSNKEDYNFALTMSKYSKYPITNIDREGRAITNTTRTLWWLDNTAVSNSYKPLFCDRDYVFKIGSLTEIKPQDKKDVFLTREGGTAWINSENSDKDPDVNDGFVDYEDVVTNTDKKKEIDIEKQKEPSYTEVCKLFDKKFKTIEELYEECPSVMLSLISDVIASDEYSIKDNLYQLNTSTIEGRMHGVFIYAISHKESIRNVMDLVCPNGILDLNELLKQKIIEEARIEQQEDEEYQARNFIDSYAYSTDESGNTHLVEIDNSKGKIITMFN